MSQGVSPMTNNGMTFPLTTQTTFGGPLSHYGLMNNGNAHSNTNGTSSWAGPASIADKNMQASANALASSSNSTTTNASLLQTQTLTLAHAASLVASTPIPSGVVVAVATQGSVTIICSPFGPKQTLLFRQGQTSQSTVSLPDTPTCITLFPLPNVSSTATASLPDGSSFQNGDGSSSSSSSCLSFNLCCAVGTSSGNVYIFDVVSRSGLPRDMTVSSVPTCVNERSLREAVDGSFAPATHQTDCAITDVAGSYSNGIQMSVLAVATPVSGVLFVRISKTADGREILIHRVTAAVNSGSTLSGDSSSASSSFIPSLQTKAVAVHAIENSKNNNITNQNDIRSFTDANSSVAIFRKSSILTFAVCYDDGCVQMVDLRLFVTATTANEPQITPFVAQILAPRDASRFLSVVSGDVYVSNDRDVTSYSVEEGGTVVLQEVPHQGAFFNNYNNNNNNNFGSSMNSNDNNNNQQQQQQNTNTSLLQNHSMTGNLQPSSSTAFNNNNTNNNNKNNSMNNNNNSNRIAVPRVNNLSCLTSFQAVASSRNNLLLITSSNAVQQQNKNSNSFNTSNLMTLPFVINDVSVLKANSAFAGDQISRLIAGSSDSIQNYAPIGNTVAFVAADRNVSLVYVKLIQ